MYPMTRNSKAQPKLTPEEQAIDQDLAFSEDAFTHLKQAAQADLLAAWLAIHHDSPRVVTVDQRDFHKLSNYPLHRRKRVMVAKDDRELTAEERPRQELLKLAFVLLERLAVQAQEATACAIYGPPKITLRWEALHIWVEIEFTYYEIQAGAGP